MSIFKRKLLSLIALILWGSTSFSALNLTATVPLEIAVIPDACSTLMVQTGDLVRAPDLIQSMANANVYLQEWETASRALGAEGYAFTTESVAHSLQAQFGPIVTLTTFSRELDRNAFAALSPHIAGLLARLKGGAIVASGGTMGNRDDASAYGGGVGIVQNMAMQLKIKTLSLTAAKGFGYRAAPADFLYFSLGGFGTESHMMERLSKALVVIGGGGQAYNEATEYLLYNPTGLLVIIDDREVIDGTSRNLLKDPRFQALAAVASSRIVIAPNGSVAGDEIARRLGIHSTSAPINMLAASKVNVADPNMDLRLLQPGSLRIGFSGWSNWDKTSEDVRDNAATHLPRITAALEHIHQLLVTGQKQVIYATTGNDPKQSITPAFETLVHNLEATDYARYVAITATKLKIEELNPRVRTLMYVSPDWQGLTQQTVARVDAFITSGGNQTVVDQATQAAKLKRHHLHILGANTLTDMRIETMRGSKDKDDGKNPNLTVLSPEQILSLDLPALLKILGAE